MSLNITASLTPASSWNAKGLKLNSMIMKEWLSKPPQIKIFLINRLPNQLQQINHWIT